jgi:hypothetical protein
VTRKLWSATLRPSSPRYEQWRKILGSSEVPILNPKPFATQLGPEGLQEVYSLDLHRFNRAQVQRLIDVMVDMFGMKPHEANRVLLTDGFPIRAVDVLVSYYVRAFL